MSTLPFSVATLAANVLYSAKTPSTPLSNSTIDTLFFNVDSVNLLYSNRRKKKEKKRRKKTKVIKKKKNVNKKKNKKI